MRESNRPNRKGLCLLVAYCLLLACLLLARFLLFWVDLRGEVCSNIFNFPGSEPQKVGGWGCTICPWNSDLSHVAQDMTRYWFWGRWTQTTHNQGHF